MILIPLLLSMQIAQTTAPDTALFPPPGDIIRLYTNCNEPRWPYGTEETFVPKTADEIASGIVRRRALEERWRAYLAVRVSDSANTPFDAWVYPLSVRGRLVDNFLQPRAGGPHEALDIFAPREGVPIRA